MERHEKDACRYQARYGGDDLTIWFTWFYGVLDVSCEIPLEWRYNGVSFIVETVILCLGSIDRSWRDYLESLSCWPAILCFTFASPVTGSIRSRMTRTWKTIQHGCAASI